MRQIRTGEEVRYQGDRWVVSRIEPGRAASYRLLRTEHGKPDVAWVPVGELSRIDSYVRAVEDTGRL